MTNPSLPPDGEWATKPYSYVVPRGAMWAAYVLMGGGYQVWSVLADHEVVLREAKKHGNRLKRLAEKSSAPVRTVVG